MTRLGWMVVLGLVGAILLAAALFAWSRARSVPPTPPSGRAATSSAAADPSSVSIYTSGEYGFAFFYPASARLRDAYSSSTPAAVSWRLGAVASGTPIVSLRSGSEEVRVGMSTAAKELKACTQAGAAEEALGPLTAGSTTWQEFTFQKLGTDDEAQVTSYRTLHHNACYALELLEPITGTASSTGYTLRETITSFSFAK